MTTLRGVALLFLAGLLITVAAVAAPATSGAIGGLPDAPAASATLTAVSDTYLDEANPATNYGSERSLLVGRSDARVPPQLRALVRFDLSGIPAAAILDRAELRLYQINAGTAASYNLYVDEVGTGWTEVAVTWNTQPPATNRGDPPALLDQTTGYKPWDVRQIVGRWLSGLAPNNGFLLRGDGSTFWYREFASRGLAGQEPKLVIEYHLAPTPTATATLTPTATATPTATRGVVASLFVTPKRAAPGAQLTVSGYGFRPGAALRLRLACPASFELGTLAADGAGGLRGVVVVPVVPPSPCVLAAWDGVARVAQTSFTVLPAMTLILNPQQGPPGTVVNFTITGLTPFELRLDYDGAAVFGPAPVTGDSFSGSFVVPNDRPEPLGALVTVQARNLRHGQVMGTARSDFQSQQGPPPPNYRVTNLRLPGSEVAAGSVFTITGQIVPPPPAPLTGFEIIPIWQQAGGRRFPIGKGPASILPDGTFQVLSHVPSLLAGDPGWPQPGDKTGVILKAAGQGSQELLAEALIPWLITPLTVLVVDAQTGLLIPGAKVALTVWDTVIQAGSLQNSGQAAMTGGANQVGGVLGINELTPDEKAQIAMEKYLCQSLLLTPPVGAKKWEVTNPSLDQALSEPAVGGLILQNTLITNGGSAQTGGVGPAATDAGDGLMHYLLTVDALDAGYGLKDGEGNIKQFGLRVNYNPADHTYRTLQGALLPNPYTVALQKLASGDLSALGPISTALAAIGAPEVDGVTGVATFRRYYSTKGVPAGTQVSAPSQPRVFTVLSTGQHAKLGPGGMKLYLDGVVVATFQLSFHSGYTCKAFKGTTGPSQPYYEGRATIPNTHLLAPGKHSLVVSAQLAGGQWVSYNYKLQVDPLPAAWFNLPAQGPRTINWAPGMVSLSTPWLAAGASDYLITSGAETDETGPLDNRTLPSQKFAQTVEANDHKGAKASGNLSGQAINKNGKGCSIPECKPVAAGAAAPQAQPAFTQSFGPTKEDVVPEVKYKIPGFVAGIPFVASVSAGGVLKYGATVTYEGQVTVFDDASIHAWTKITPEAHVAGGMYIDAYILGGVVNYSSAELTAGMGLQMPVTYDTVTGTDTGDACFTYRSDLYTYSGWFCIPWTDICAWDDEGHEVLFSGAKPSGCNSAAAAAAPRQSRPVKSYASLASNGFGQIMAVWQGGRSSLATSLWDGEVWSSPVVIPTGLGSTGPKVAFLTPNRAIAAWTETNLTEAQLPGLTGADVVRAQRIAYALWDGAGWSAAQPLTVPSLGDGGVALATCPEWQAGCPAGGEAAVVWERNLHADFNARRIRLYYDIYRAGAWSAVQPVDAASAATDILPAVAYRNGTPLVAWVRDGDTDQTDAGSRRIVLRSLPGGPVSSPDELPGAVLEVALAVDGVGTPLLAFTQAEDPAQVLGNRRPLWAGRGDCEGDTCAWEARKLTDPLGRSFYAERPLLEVNSEDRPVITFRGLGFGGDVPPQPGDPPGMTSGLGELAQVVVDFGAGFVVPTYLTQDGAVNWLPAAVYDPALDLTVSTVVKGPVSAGASPAGVSPLELPMAARPSSAGGLPVGGIVSLAFQVAPDLPDFAVTGVEPSSFYPGPLDPLSVSVQVANAGAPWAGSVDSPLRIVATWDGGPGAGAPAGESVLLGLGGSAEVMIDLAAPVEGLDEPHTLFVTANPGLALPDRDPANNALTLTIGGVAPPAGLWAEVKPGSPLVFLDWDPPASDGSAGYRIYRAEGDGPFLPIGSALAPGYVDLTATTLHRYRYGVSAYSETGAESDLGAPVIVTPPARRTYLPVAAR